MNNLSMKYTGEIIKKLREEKGESQEQLATAIHAPNRETITRWENGSRDLKREHIIALAKHFNVSSDYLLGLSDIPSADTDIQTACKTTGLNEEAIKNLISEIERWKEYAMNDFEIQKYMDIRNSIISSGEFNCLVFVCWSLFERSTKCLTFLELPASELLEVAEKMKISDIALCRYIFQQLLPDIKEREKNFNSIEYRDSYRECDLDRYNILKTAEKISNMFDRRTEYLEYDENELLAFFKIDEETLKQMREQGENYGKHNSTEE